MATNLPTNSPFLSTIYILKVYIFIISWQNKLVLIVLTGSIQLLCTYEKLLLRLGENEEKNEKFTNNIENLQSC